MLQLTVARKYTFPDLIKYNYLANFQKTHPPQPTATTPTTPTTRKKSSTRLNRQPCETSEKSNKPFKPEKCLPANDPSLSLQLSNTCN